MRNSLRAATATAVVIGIGAAPAVASAKSVTITQSGSTSVAPLSKLLNKKYASAKKGKVKFKLALGGSDVGISDAAKGKVSIGMSSRDKKPNDPKSLAFYKVARDAVCVITNPNNKVGNLTQSQVQDIYSGKITSWDKVPGASASGTINLIGRNSSSGTADAFSKLFMGTTKISGSMKGLASQGLVNSAIKSDTNAIGYESLGGVSGTNVVGYNGATCTRDNAVNGSYAAVRNFWLVTKGIAKGPVAEYINWVRTNSAASKIINVDYLPYK